MVLPEVWHPYDVTRRDVCSVAAVHEDQRLELFAAANVTEAIIANAHRHELSQRGEVGQSRESCVVDKLATDSEAFQRRHPGECNKPWAFKVRTLTTPEVFD